MTFDHRSAQKPRVFNQLSSFSESARSAGVSCVHLSIQAFRRAVRDIAKNANTGIGPAMSNSPLQAAAALASVVPSFLLTGNRC
jgi:hypothetical protein